MTTEPAEHPEECPYCGMGLLRTHLNGRIRDTQYRCFTRVLHNQWQRNSGCELLARHRRPYEHKREDEEA